MRPNSTKPAAGYNELILNTSFEHRIEVEIPIPKPERQPIVLRTVGSYTIVVELQGLGSANWCPLVRAETAPFCVVMYTIYNYRFC